MDAVNSQMENQKKFQTSDLHLSICVPYQYEPAVTNSGGLERDLWGRVVVKGWRQGLVFQDLLDCFASSLRTSYYLIAQSWMG